MTITLNYLVSCNRINILYIHYTITVNGKCSLIIQGFTFFSLLAESNVCLIKSDSNIEDI